MDENHNPDENPSDETQATRPTPGATELEALLNLALFGGIYASVGYVAGIVVPLMLLGLIFEGNPFVAFDSDAAIGVVLVIGAALWGSTMFVGMRGRIPLPALMSWAGAILGTSFAALGPDDFLEFIGSVLAGTVLATGGAIGAAMAVNQYHVVEGLGRRTWRHFTTKDLLVVMAIVAINLVALRFYVVWNAVPWLAVGWWMVLSAGCGLVANLVLAILRGLHRDLRVAKGAE